MPFPQGLAVDGDTWRMEQFSRAYVTAVAAAAGCSTSMPDVDDDSVDLTLRKRTVNTPVRSPKLDIQLKATYADCVNDTHLAYPLSIKNYDELRADNYVVPRILVVVHMKPQIEDWLLHSEGNLALHRCGYWLSLKGKPQVANTTSRTVHIPRTQLFSVEGLHEIFERLQNGGAP